jgi:hypothetical protein
LEERLATRELDERPSERKDLIQNIVDRERVSLVERMRRIAPDAAGRAGGETGAFDLPRIIGERPTTGRCARRFASRIADLNQVTFARSSEA